MRLARIQAKAVETFGSETDGWRWLHEPLELLGNTSPLEIAATDAGAYLVETLLAKIAWGAAA